MRCTRGTDTKLGRLVLAQVCRGWSRGRGLPRGPEVVSGAVSIQTPLALLGFLALPVLLVLRSWSNRRRPPDAVRFSNLDMLASVAAEERWSYRRWLPGTLALAAVASLVLGLARPLLRLSAGQPVATVVFVVDSAGSTAEKDLGPSRLLVAKQMALTLLARLPGRTRVGLVALESDEPESTETGQAQTGSDDAQVLAYPTTDHTSLGPMIGALSLGYPSESGDGLAAALAVINETRSQFRRGSGSSARRSDRPNARIELLTDGQDNSGRALALREARQARRSRVAIDAIILNGGEELADAALPEAGTLQHIAQLSGGQTYTLGNGAQLSKLNRQLAASITTTHTRREVTGFLLAAGTVFIGSATILSLLWRPRLP